jgi:hypothetical protein
MYPSTNSNFLQCSRPLSTPMCSDDWPPKISTRGLLYGTNLNSLNLLCDVIFSLMRKICYTQYINYNKKMARWHGGGVVVHKLWLMVQFRCKIFTSCLVECMNSFNTRIHLYYEWVMLVVPLLNSSIPILVLRCLDLDLIEFIFYILWRHFRVCFGTALYVENVK